MTARAPYPGRPLYILTSSAGTTCCEASPPALQREMARLPHVAPVKVDQWVRGEKPTEYGGWIKTRSFLWPSGAEN